MVPRIQSLLLAFLALLAFHPNTHVYVSAYSDNAGPLCSLSASAISEMARSRHGGQSSGGGFSVSAVDNGDGTYSVGVAGGSFRGLLLIARDEADNLVGGFSNVPSGLSIKSDCGGSAAVEHNSPSTKSGSSMTYTPPSAFSGKIYFEAMIVVRTPSWYIATPATIDLSAAPAETATVTSVGPSGAATATVTRTAATGTAKTTTTKTPTSNPVAGNPTTANLLTFESVATSPTIFYILWSAIAALALISLCTRRMENGVENRALDTAIVHAAARREEMTMAPTWNSSVHGQQQIASRGQNGTVRAQAPEVPTLARTTMRDPGVWGGSTYDPWRGGR